MNKTIHSARYVLLDTSTIAHLASSRPRTESQELIHHLSSGEWIPFLTHHLLEEISFHEDDEAFERRWSILERLPHIAFARLEDATEMIGSVFDLRALEIDYLTSNPGASHSDIISAVKPLIFTGFSTGADFVSQYREFWRSYKRYLAPEKRRRVAEIANIRHFNTINLNEPIPKPGESLCYRNREEAVAPFETLAAQLHNLLVKRGDVRHFDPDETATRFMVENLEAFPAGAKGTFDNFLRHFNVKRERLPENATWGDVGEEGIFASQLTIYAEFRGKNLAEVMSVVQKEAVPSWVVWNNLDKIIRKMQSPEMGNLADMHTAQFGLYVDLLNADKRIAEAFRQGSLRVPLMREVYRRIPRTRGMVGLLEALRTTN